MDSGEGHWGKCFYFVLSLRLSIIKGFETEYHNTDSFKTFVKTFAEAFTLNIQNTTKTKVFHTSFGVTTYASRFKVDWKETFRSPG